jgi:hypothetical protein
VNVDEFLSAIDRPVTIVVPLIALLLGWWLGRRSRAADWERDDRRRLTADKRRLYAEFLSAAERFLDDSNREVTALQRAPAGPLPAAVPTAGQDASDIVFQQLSLLAPTSVAKAAQAVRDALLRLEMVGVQLRSRRLGVEVAEIPDAEIERRRQAARQALTDFLQAARADLGVDAPTSGRQP